MPARARGSTYKTAKHGVGIRWYDRAGRRQFKSGFQSKSEARSWWEDAVRPQLEGRAPAPEPVTFSAFSENYLRRYEAVRAPATSRSLRWRLARPLAEFGALRLDEIRTAEVALWEAALPPRFRHDVMRSLRMLGRAAVEWGYLERNPFVTGANPAPVVIEREVLTPAEVESLAEEMRPPFDAAVVVGAWCYLRPSELLSLERRDVGDGTLEVHGRKTRRSRRSVPVPLRAAQALSGLPARLDTRLLFPAPLGGVYALGNFRRREFEWAVGAAGLPKATTPYTLRHSGLSWALAAGIPAVDVARFGGTSLAMLERTYHHLLVGSAESARRRMDEFATEEAASEQTR
jgi:integrase